MASFGSQGLPDSNLTQKIGAGFSAGRRGRLRQVNALSLGVNAITNVTAGNLSMKVAGFYRPNRFDW
jgi:hypothetical protein